MNLQVAQGGFLLTPAPGVLANDTDPLTTNLSAVLVQGPLYGTLFFNANGSFTYTPNAQFQGQDSFTYQVYAGTFAGTIAQVTITVLPPSGANLGSIGDFVFVDANGNGVQDAGESGLAGLRVWLYDANNVLVAWTVTGSNGVYQLQGIAAGNYYLLFERPDGMAFTDQDEGTDDTIDSDADADGRTALFALLAGEIDNDLDAGLYWLT